MRLTTKQIVTKAYINLREREHAHKGTELPRQCPEQLRMAMEMADEIAQWRFMERVDPKHRTKPTGGRK